MLERASDHLARRAQQLGLDREKVLNRAQAVLDELYPGQARALSLNQGTLKIVTPSAPVASELRLRQIELMKLCSAAGHEVKKLQIQIRG